MVSLALGAAAVVAVVAVVVATSAGNGNDAALHDFLALATRREQATWLVHFRFERRVASGAHFAQPLTEANRPPIHVASGGGTVTVDFGDHVASCTATPTVPRCTDHKSSPSLAPSAVYRVATSLGGYTVKRGPTMTIAGEHATCFDVVAHDGKTNPTLGDETVQCYAADGVPLRSELHHGGTVDTRVATSVTRHVTNAALDALLRELDREKSASGR